jgi:hypothetical protein
VILYDRFDSEFVLNDYLHFCFAKSGRSLEAVAALFHEAFREDSFSLLRTVYENYLHFWYVVRHPETLNSFINAKLGKSTRKLHHPKSGAARHLKVVDPNTGQIHDYGRPMSVLAKDGSPRITGQFHELVYEYLCEFTHNHFMAFGGYLDPRIPAKITSHRHGKDVEVVAYALLLSTLWLESFQMIESPEEHHRRRIRYNMRSSACALKDTLGILSSEGKYRTLQIELLSVIGTLGTSIAL